MFVSLNPFTVNSGTRYGDPVHGHVAAVREDHDVLLPRVEKVAWGTQVEEVVPVAHDSQHYPDLAGGVMKMEHILGNLGAGLVEGTNNAMVYPGSVWWLSGSRCHCRCAWLGQDLNILKIIWQQLFLLGVLLCHNCRKLLKPLLWEDDCINTVKKTTNNINHQSFNLIIGWVKRSVDIILK